MEAQQPHWPTEEPTEESLVVYAGEQDAKLSTEADDTSSFELDESGVIAEAVKLQAKTSPESSLQPVGADEITEKDLEIRHEIQDDPGESQAVSVGEILTDLVVSQPELVKATPTQAVSPASGATSDDPDDDISGSDSNNSLTYTQAIRLGLMTALLVIIGFGVIQFIF